MVRGRPGVGPQTEKREHWARLIARGVSNSEACRIVGINVRTGKRWRHGRTVTTSDGRSLHYAPVITSRKAEISGRYLSEDERVTIAELRRQGLSMQAVAEKIGRSPSTISRELRRNLDPDRGQYRPFVAQKLAVDRRTRPGRGKIVNDDVLREFVSNLLKKRWSPEQISHELTIAFSDDPARLLVPETIYQAVYRPELGGLHRELPKALRTGRRRRKPNRRGDERRGRLVDMTMIDQRPAEADDRATPGHWEGDLIIGELTRSAIGTLVERSSRFTILLHLPAGRHTAQAVRDALIEAMSALPAHLRRSLTWDQGKEMAMHAEIASALGMPVFFCQKASPWQRPSNENTNGLLRDYFPKGSDLRVHDADRLVAVAAELNDRPRRTLGWATPARLLEQFTRESTR
jgi:transposase, IS30 family